MIRRPPKPPLFPSPTLSRSPAVPERLAQNRPRPSKPAREGDHDDNEMGPGHPPGARITPVAAFSRRQPSAAVRPVHAERVAALVALHVLRLSGDVPPLVAPRADE